MTLRWPRLSVLCKRRRQAHPGTMGIRASVGFLLVLMIRPGLGQQLVSQQLPSVRKASRAPLSHIYMHFLLYQNHLDRAAAAREKEGKDGSWLRDHFQQVLGFTASQFAIVRVGARQLEDDLKANRDQAIAVIEADRTSHPDHTGAARVRAVPSPQLEDLVKQREDLIEHAEADLDRKLGPEAAAKLQAFLKNNFIRNTTSRPPYVRPQSSLPMLPPSHGQMVQP